MKRTIFFLFCCFTLGLQAQPEWPKKIGVKHTQNLPVDASRLDRQASELMANYLSPAKITGELALSII